MNITSIDTATVKKIAVSENRNYSFEKNGEEWTESSLPGEDMDETAVKSIIAGVCSLYTTETVIENAQNPADYGLDEKFLTVTITQEDDHETILHVGDLNNVLNKFYVQLEGDPDIYLVNYSDISGLITNAESFIAEEETEITEEAEAENVSE